MSARGCSQNSGKLERDGLVIRTLHPEIPPRVDYQSTDAGKAFIPILERISTWVLAYCPEAAEKIGR